MKIVTHSGHFHADDVLAVATLFLIYPDAEVIRSREDSTINLGDIVVDVGLIYDPQKKRFDHHQPAGAGSRPNTVPYASFGLIWKEFGEIVSGGKDEAKVIEDKLVTPVDAWDNGVTIATPNIENITPYGIWHFFESFSADVKIEEDFDSNFMKALPIAMDLIKREIIIAKKTVENWKEVERIYNESKNKKIIVLPESLHYKRVLVPTEAVYVVRPRPDGFWSVRAIPADVTGFQVKKHFPMSWAGLKGETMASVSEVPDATFCHRDRWIAGAKTMEGAIKLAEIALNA